MLILYDINHNKIAGLKNYKEYKIEREINKLDILSFLYPVNDRNHDSILHEGYIRTKENEYVIKEINYSDESYDQYVCKINIETIQGTPVSHFETVEQNCADAVNLALAGTGWTIGTCDVTKKRTTRKNNCSAYDVLVEIQSVYRCEMTFDAINKKVYIYQAMGSDKGVYFSDQLNLKKVDTQSDSYDYITRLISLGKDGLDITSVNSGKNYVENYQYSDKVITAYWEDNRYTVAQNLKDDAIERLNYLSKPLRAYKADIIDLANTNDKYKNILDYNLGDTITLLSKERNVKEKQRIVKLVEYPDEPERNTVEIANKIASLDDLNVRFENTSDTVDSVTTSAGGLDGSKVDSIDAVTQIRNLDSEVARITNLTVINANIDNLFADKANINELNAVTARIGTLEATSAKITDLDAINADIVNLHADKADITDLTATNAKITTLEATAASIQTQLSDTISTVNLNAENITAVNATIEDLQAGKANISDLTAATARIGNLEANSATITNLNVTNANITNLTADVADIQELVAGNITSANMAVGAIGVGNAVIANGAIGDAMIANLSVSKLLAGNISTTKFVVKSDSGNLKIQDNTLHVWDSNGKERISLGKNGTDYNLLIRGTDGNTVLFGVDGVTHAGITTGAIDDSNVAVGANINGGKIEKESLISQINGATTLMKASKIKLDTEAQTLDIAFTNLKSTVTTTSNTVSSQGTSISAIQGQITNKIWQTDITTAVDNLQVGGTNLLKDSNFELGTALIGNVNGAVVSITSEDSYLDSKCLKIISAESSNSSGGSIICSKLIIGIKYTASLWVKCTTNDNVNFRIINTSNWDTVTSYSRTLEANIWTKLVLSFVAKETSHRICILNGVTKALNYYVDIVKVELGDKATDWSPAPEDTQGQITTINSNYSTLTQTVNGITSTVGSLSSSIDTTNNNVTSVNNTVSTLSQTVDSLSSSITSVKSDYLKKADASTTYATNTSVSSLSQTVNSLSSTISNVQTSVDNIQVGGRNLIKNSNGGSNYTSAWKIYSTFGSGAAVTYDVANDAWKFRSPENYSDYSDATDIQWIYTFDNLEVGKSYIASIWIKSPYNSGVSLCTYGTNLNKTSQFTNSNSTTWTKISLVFTATAVDNTIRVFLGKAFNYVDLFFKLKCEIGNKATDWSPAPEDVQGQITSTNTSVSTLSQTVDSLSSTISNVQTTYLKKADASTTYATSSTVSTLSQTLSGLSSTVTSVQSTVSSQGSTISSHTSSISSLTSSIALKLDSTTFNSYKTTNDTNITSINNKLNSHSSSITVLQDSITSKVTQAEIDSAVGAIQGMNLIPDGSFENGGVGWGSGGQLVDDGHSGVHCIRFQSAEFKGLKNTIIVVPGHKYRISLWYSTSSDNNGTDNNQKLRIGKASDGSLATTIALGTNATSWTKKSIEWTMPSDIYEISVSIGTDLTTGWIRYDDLEMVDITDINGLDTRISTNESSITQLQDSIALKVSTSTFNNSVSTLNSSIANKANQSSLDTTNSNVNSISSRLTTAESSISILNNSITTKVTQTDINNSINNLNIGSNNLIKNSDFSSNLNYWTNASSGLSVSATYGPSTPSVYNKKCILLNNTTASEKYIWQTGIKLKPNTKYTLSFYYTHNLSGNDHTIDVFVLGQTSSQVNTYGYTYNHSVQGLSSAGWVRKSLTFTTHNDEVGCCIRLDNNGSTSGVAAFTMLQLEEGEKVTAWKPALEDIQDYTDGKIDTVNGTISTMQTSLSTATSDITQLKNQITLKVETSTFNSTVTTINSNVNSKASQSSLNTTNSNVTSLTSRVSTAESSISVLQGQITTKVTQTDIDNAVGAIQGMNLIPDGSFENGGVGWGSGGQLVDDGHSGVHCIRFQNSGGSKTLKNPIVVFPGRKYRISLWYNTDSTNNGTAGNQKLRIGNTDDGSVLTAIALDTNTNSAWTKKSIEWTIPGGVYRITLSINSDLTAGWIRYDDLEMVDITDIDGLDSRISTAESSITQLSTSITSKVDVNGVKSTIKQSSSEVLTAFNGITGKVTIKNGNLELQNLNDTKVMWVNTTGRLTCNSLDVYGAGGETVYFHGNGSKTVKIQSDNGGTCSVSFRSNNYGMESKADILSYTDAQPLGNLFIQPRDYFVIRSSETTSEENKPVHTELWGDLVINGGTYVKGDGHNSKSWQNTYTPGSITVNKARITNLSKSDSEVYVYGLRVKSFSMPENYSYLNVTANDNSAYGISIVSSDRSLKYNIQDSTENALTRINMIKHREFYWKKDNRFQGLGVVSQELEEINPDWVFAVPQPDGSVRKQPNEATIIPYLTKSIQELSAQINELKEEIAELKANEAS
ncbi:phage tail protein [Clostridium pasteurianum]|uniref:phage tail spike protein n=1 Tax=Clostridium pasteurianum TaxID=1501 RepID=UPI002260F66B|nr:phage tail spike protein [Clostridium pasteurianum]UZW13182.1 phage tail protein [Clostridium pasteurianum]